MRARPPRIVLAKPGLDGHDRGIKVIAMALRDAGAEVIYLGLRRSVAEIVQAAADDDADVIGISVLSGAHLALAEQLLHERDARGMSGVPVVLGGTIPPGDTDALRALGIAEVFPVGTNLLVVCEALLSLAAGTRAAR
jgi:methylmalonyl-CoA mutase C-terminal domain/subunit